MIRWLEDNPVGRVLAAVAGVLVVVALLLGVVWSLPPAGSADSVGGADETLMPDVPQLEESEPIEMNAKTAKKILIKEIFAPACPRRR